MILEQTIQEVFDTAAVEEVVGEFVHLKQRGSNLIGLCPFHDEKTPSFTVSPTKGIYKCFGCGKGGNSVNFLMEHEQMSFPEAIRYLARKYNIEIKEDRRQEDTEEARLRESLFVLTDFVAEFYHDCLVHGQEGKSIGMSYFAERQLTDTAIEKFQLGYAPESGTALIEKVKEASYSTDKLKEAGLLNRYEKDFFRGRIIFPIHNLSGKVVAFAGRTMSKRKNVPKYINSPETEIYHKRKILYGMHLARNGVRRKNQCILVEGYMDVIALAQEGIENVVATSGTSLTEEQVRLIKRYTDNVLLLYDGDDAGLNAAERGIDIMLAQDLNISLVALPDKHDPDSYIKEVGKENFEEFITENSMDFLLFKLQKNSAKAADNPVERVRILKDLVNSIALIPDPLKRSLYIRQVSEKLEVQEQLLSDELAKSIKDHQETRRRKERSEQRRRERNTLKEIKQKNTSVRHKMPELSDEAQEKAIVRVLLQFGLQVYTDESDTETTIGENILINIQDVMQYIENDGYQKILSMYKKNYEESGEILDSSYFIRHEDAAIRGIAIDLLSNPYEYSENWVKKWDMPLQTQEMPEQNYLKDMIQAILNLKLRKIDKLIEANRNKIAMHQKDENEDGLLTQLEVQNNLIKIRQAIAKKLGRVLY